MPKDIYPSRETLIVNRDQHAIAASATSPTQETSSAATRRASLAFISAADSRGSDGMLHDFLVREFATEERDKSKVADRLNGQSAAVAFQRPLDCIGMLKKRKCEMFGLPILYRETLRTHLMEPLIHIWRGKVDLVSGHYRPNSRGSVNVRPSSRGMDSPPSPGSRYSLSGSRPGSRGGRPGSRGSQRSVPTLNKLGSAEPLSPLSPKGAPSSLKAGSSKVLMDIFRYHVLNIIRLTRQAICLGAEVDNWFMRYRMLHGSGYWKGGSEPVDERHTRLQEYWSDFHENPRTVNGPIVGMLGKTSPVGLSGTPTNSPKSAELRDRSPRPVKPGSGLELSAASESPWKDRSWRSKCSAGSWNHAMRPEGSARIMKASRSAPSLAYKREDPQSSQKQQPTLTLPSLDATGFTVSQILSRRQRKASGWLPEEKTVQADPLEAIDPRLPPIFSKVVPGEPWCDPKSPPSRKAASASIRRYLRECEENKLVPLLVPFLTGHSTKLCSEGRSPTDADLQAITAMVPCLPRIEVLDLGDCTQLTERALLPFAEALQANPAAARSVLKLNLSACRAGAATMECLVDMLDDASSMNKLQQLNLDGVAIGTKRQIKLCTVIAGHPNLKSLHMADTGLSGQTAVRCIDELLNSDVLDELDLSWNCLTAEAYTVMGTHLLENQTMRKLSLANSATVSKGEVITPIAVLLEMLSQDRTLTEIDISLNRLDFRGALVIEDALQYHKKLTVMNVSNNPLGVLGMRSLLRLLSSNDSGLINFDCHGCAGDPDMRSEEKFQFFSATNPSGRYTLRLSNPYHRAVLRMLCKTSVRFKLDTSETFKDVIFHPGSFSRPSLSPDGTWIVPTTGNLAVTFSIEKAMQVVHNVKDVWNFEQFLHRHFSAMRLQPAFRKIVPIHGEWRSIMGLRNEQRVFLSALSKDLKISPEGVVEFCQAHRSMAAEVLWELLPCIEGGIAMLYVCMLQCPGLLIYISLLTRMRGFLAFNPENPTGHYKLDLGNPTDYAVGDRLLLLDRWEATLAEQLGRRDVSQKGNRSRIINEVFMGAALPVASVAEWNMPEFDIFEFDYSSGKRLSPDEKPVDDVTITTLILSLQQSASPQKDQVEVLRTVSHLINLTALQLRALVGIYRDPSIRAEIFLIMFFRLTDIYNEKMFRCRLQSDEIQKLKQRIGYVSFFPFIQPEQTVFTFQLRYHDQRMALNLIFQLCAKEGWHNLRDAYYITEQGIVDDLAMGVPKSWETFEKMPKGGVFSGKYTCSPENRDYNLRRRFLQTYGFWKCNVTTDEVCWWSDLQDAPQDVLDFLEFLIVAFPNVEKAFTAIDGPGGNGVITLREFEEGVPEVGCTKFEGPDEREHITGIFRYLDPDNGGTISRAEFGVMEQMLKEIKLSIFEFVQFLQRTFGEDLDDAWEKLDDDGSGEIDEAEWQECCNVIGYFGPTRPIFAFLDKDDEGTICFEEFKELEDHKQIPKGLMPERA